MTKKSLKPCIITEKELVKIFANKKQKETYITNGRFIGTAKQTVLKEASRYCVIKDIGDRQYQIEEVYRFVIPRNFARMNTGLYQYTCPLVIQSIMVKSPLSMELTEWEKCLHIVNDKYFSYRYSREPIIQDFYSHVSDMADIYVKNTFSHLSKARVIDYKPVYGIKCVYREYTIICLGQERCKALLEQFNSEDCIKNLQGAFIKRIMENIKKRTQDSDTINKYQELCNECIA